MSADTKWPKGEWKARGGTVLIKQPMRNVKSEFAWLTFVTVVPVESHEDSDAAARLFAVSRDLYATLEEAEFQLRSAGNMLSAICESDPSRDRRAAANRAINAANDCALVLYRARGEDSDHA